MFQRVFPLSRAAVAGTLAVGMAIAISSFTVVRAEHIKPDKNCNTSKPCGYFNNTGSGGIGVEGQAVSQSGVYGVSSQSGVYAQTNDTTGKYYGLRAAAGPNAGGILYGSTTAGSVLVDPSGNGTFSGTVTATKFIKKTLTKTGQRVLTFASESASATLEDVGTARLAGGVANVAIDRAFAAVTDGSSAYHIFLTPMGDTRGLFVSLKTPAGFQVREAQGGRSNIAFDYRIVARPLDSQNARLPLAPAVKAPPR